MTIHQKISALRARIAQTPDGALLVPSSDLCMIFDALDRSVSREDRTATLLRAAQNLIEARDTLKHAQGLIDSANIRAYNEVIPALDRLQDRLDAGCHLVKMDSTKYALFDMLDVIASGKTVRELMVNLVMVDC